MADDCDWRVGTNVEGGTWSQFISSQYTGFPRTRRTISEPKAQEVTGGWRQLHSDDLNNMYCWSTGDRIKGEISGYLERTGG